MRSSSNPSLHLCHMWASFWPMANFSAKYLIQIVSSYTWILHKNSKNHNLPIKLIKCWNDAVNNVTLSNQVHIDSTTSPNLQCKLQCNCNKFDSLLQMWNFFTVLWTLQICQGGNNFKIKLTFFHMSDNFVTILWKCSCTSHLPCCCENNENACWFFTS